MAPEFQEGFPAEMLDHYLRLQEGANDHRMRAVVEEDLAALPGVRDPREQASPFAGTGPTTLRPRVSPHRP